MTDQDNLRDRIEDTIEAAYAQWEFEFEAHEDGSRAYVDPGPKGAFVAQAIIDQLRTDEAVARLANFLHNDDVGETLNEHEESCRRPDCNERDLYAEYAHAAITALLGDN